MGIKEILNMKDLELGRLLQLDLSSSPDINSIELSDQNTMEALIVALNKCHELQSLNLSNNALRRFAPKIIRGLAEVFAKLPNLHELDLSYNGFWLSDELESLDACYMDYLIDGLQKNPGLEKLTIGEGNSIIPKHIINSLREKLSPVQLHHIEQQPNISVLKRKFKF